MKYQEWKAILQKGIDGILTGDESENLDIQYGDWNCCAVCVDPDYGSGIDLQSDINEILDNNLTKNI